MGDNSFRIFIIHSHCWKRYQINEIRKNLLAQILCKYFKTPMKKNYVKLILFYISMNGNGIAYIRIFFIEFSFKNFQRINKFAITSVTLSISFHLHMNSVSILFEILIITVSDCILVAVCKRYLPTEANNFSSASSKYHRKNFPFSS